MSDKINFEEKITGSLTSFINSLIESFQTFLKDELNNMVEKIQVEFNRLNENIKGLIETQNVFKTKIEELSATSDNIMRNVEKTLQAELNDKMNAHFKEFHEEMEKIIDMNAALTVELSNRLDTALEKIDSLSASEDKQKDMVVELDKKIKSQLDKSSTIFESRIDGLRKQIEDMITPEVSSIHNVQEKLDHLNKMLNDLTGKLAVLKIESELVEKQAVKE
ncbi:MAG: hypothetical protein OdinLCB4_000255 [Candidatus Odinarchaeum yellowstonii]|uniref:Uncharacterized protein n=1 Tax=Odinarchaeota yellowstonii (strain LCB_4) TaxID=1841599 RepID=A0AAF0D2B0_ODILC|nr:MAG: hypothetical protein OdinLCB4_000255 [Candidatus Odinarchaeum yellowstonii]